MAAGTAAITGQKPVITKGEQSVVEFQAH
ncbi:MAG: hypothetical protein R3C01_06850 [Planctomycetaceae bacterium]